MEAGVPTTTWPTAAGAQPAASVQPVTVIGVADDRLELLSPEALEALAHAEAVVGARRHLRLWQAWRAWSGVTTPAPDIFEVGADAGEAAQAVRRWSVEARRRVCVLAAGDPGFFGIVRALLRAVDRTSLRVIPAPSSVSLAFARLGLPWDDALVVSAHGRSIDDAVQAVRTARKAAVLTSPDAPPEVVGAALLDVGAAMDLVAVCSRLGSPDERVFDLTLPELASGRFDPLSVLVLVGPGGLPLVGWEPGSGTALAWGAPDLAYDQRARTLAKAEVRSVVLGKLALPQRGVVWDVGAGSGGVAAECAIAQPGLTVLAVEEDADAAARVSANALALGAGVHVVTGRAPEVLDTLPVPDRAFVGGGGLIVLDSVLERLRPGGLVVGAYAALDRAAAAAERLGNLVQVTVARGERLPDGGWRLAAHDPVFVAWGPT